VNEPDIRNIEQADPALQFVMRANRARYWEIDQFGDIFIHKPKHGRGTPYDRIKVPNDELEVIRIRRESGEPQQDFAGILNPPKPLRRRTGRPVRR
jgi:hypothetical protein